ncbi:NUDIX domain-containing protein [Roseovarius aestuariivivens]|uniref:NUDIX domain-containing protein n=1 Tax=Roseovarius aestuariivivens TaxID=1888910 RepID=UPI0010820A32|nr:NUDIX hydrolase [Roseovarius aestuariivivens]
MSNADSFSGAKLVLFLGDRIVVLRRDVKPRLEWPGCLDLPGGGRHGGESPEDCVLRETREEIGLRLDPGDLVWRCFYREPNRAWFFAAHLPEARESDIVFGAEGRGWHLMRPEDFVNAPDAIPHFRDRVGAYLRVRARVEGRDKGRG